MDFHPELGSKPNKFSKKKINTAQVILIPAVMKILGTLNVAYVRKSHFIY